MAIGEIPLFVDLVVGPASGVELGQDVFSTGIGFSQDGAPTNWGQA